MDYAAQLKQYIDTKAIPCTHISLEANCHSVAQAATAVGASPTDFVKNIRMISDNGQFIVGIVKGEDRIDLEKVGMIVTSKVRIAKPDEALAKSGYPVGSTPSFGYDARFLIDIAVFDKDIVYTGGGSDHSLVRIAPKKLLLANNGTIATIKIEKKSTMFVLQGSN